MKMKTNVLLFAALMIFSLNLQAQNETYRSTITVNAGMSLITALLDIGEEVFIEDRGTFRVSSLPALQISYDYGLNPWLSIGAAASHQVITFTSSPKEDKNEKIHFDRVNVGIRPLFHYSSNEKIDLYSGVRVSYLTLGARNSEGENSGFAFEESAFTGFRVQLIAFGIRGYFNDHIGLNMEVAVGAPHYLSGGLNYRF